MPLPLQAPAIIQHSEQAYPWSFASPAPSARLFINLYFVGTGLHAVHLTVGILLVLGLALRVKKRWTPLPERAVTVEMVGLYWHLVDVIWVFMYPVLYLARG